MTNHGVHRVFYAEGLPFVSPEEDRGGKEQIMKHCLVKLHVREQVRTMRYINCCAQKESPWCHLKKTMVARKR